MLVEFFFKLRQAKVPVTITEFLLLLEALEARLGMLDAEDFYFLSRAALIKNERHFDRFDLAFAAHFKGVLDRFESLIRDLPKEWTEGSWQRLFSEEEKRQVESLGGWDKLMETLRKRLEEQQKRHEGGSRWIGTRGTSPFGADGYNPEGIRIGQAGGRHRSAVKVWEKRAYRNLDDQVELGTRNMKVALRKLRKFARQGAEDELDLDHTIGATAKNAGLLDLKFRPERRNAIKVLLLLDIGGSMDDYVRVSERLFSAARSEFKQLKFYYFHNCVYERLWKDNRRRALDYISSLELMRTYDKEYRVIYVGDASMSPYEILFPGGSVEHMNEEAGSDWLHRMLEAFPRSIWINPHPERSWDYTPSIGIIRDLFSNRMFPLTVEGLEKGMQELRRTAAPPAPPRPTQL